MNSSSSTRMSRKTCHIFKCGGICSKINIILDRAAPHRRSSSSSGLLKREDCFTLPRAEQVRTPLPRYHARSTVRARSPISRFHARSLYSYQYHYDVRGKRHTIVSTLPHAKLVHSSLLSRCGHYCLLYTSPSPRDS